MQRSAWVSQRYPRYLMGLALCGAAWVGCCGPALGQFINAQRVYSYDYYPNAADFPPLYATAVPGAPNFLGLAGKRGGIDLLNLTTGQVSPLLRIPLDFQTLFDDDPQLFVDAYESGLTGLAFHPNFNKPGMPGYRKFYVDATFDNSVVPGSPFIQVGDPTAITPTELQTINDDARIPFTEPFIPANPDGVLRKCFVCDHAQMQMEMRLSNGTSGQFTGVECFDENSQGFRTNFKPAQRLQPMYTEVREYMVDDHGSADPAMWTVDNSMYKTVVRLRNERDFHNGGWIDFGPDGMLYISTGDNKGHPTELFTYPEDPAADLHGKILRVDVNGSSDVYDQDAPLILNVGIPPGNPFVGNGTAADDPVWAIGFRNPWRGSFDRVTGELRIGDVGFNTKEEINLVTPGFNGGWPFYEGTTPTELTQLFLDTHAGGTRPPLSETDLPEYEYSHPPQNDVTHPWWRRGAAVMGGYVIRGPDPKLQGKYLFYESGQRQIFSLNPETGDVQDISDTFFDYYSTPVTDANGNFLYSALAPYTYTETGALRPVGLFVSFAEDAAGNLYLIGYFSGDIYKLTTTDMDPDTIPPGMPGTRGDFNADGMVDDEDIDLLALAARPGAKPPLPVYDLNDSALVTFAASTSGIQSDSDLLIRQVLGTEYGDANLDQKVNALDTSILVTRLGTAGGWADGDFNGDGLVNALDTSILISHLGFSAPMPALTDAWLALPEPAFSTLATIGLLMIWSHARPARRGLRVPQCAMEARYLSQ